MFFDLKSKPSSAIRLLLPCLRPVILLIFVQSQSFAQPVQLDQSEKIREVKKIEEKAIARKDSLMLADAYYQYGLVYSFAGDNTTSKQYFLNALKILEPRGDSYELGMTYYRLAGNLELRGDTDTEVLYGFKGLNVFKNIKSQKGLAYASRIVGGSFARKVRSGANDMNFDSALYYYRQSEASAAKIKDTLNVADANIHLGNLYTIIKDPRSITFLKKALSLFSTIKTNDGDFGTVHTLLSLTAVYFNFNRYPEAYETLMEAENLYETKNLNDHHVKSRILESYRDYYQGIGNWRLAFDYMQKLYHFQNINFMSENSSAMARMNVEYESEKKDLLLTSQQKEIALRKENLRFQYYLIGAISALFAVTLFATVLFYRLYKKNQKTSRKNEILVREQHHRVKNNLQMVSSLMGMQARHLSDRDARNAVEESKLRIQAMALIQRKLYDYLDVTTLNLADFIPELADDALAACGFSRIQKIYHIDPISLHLDKTIPLGLIITELIINSSKYAFPDHPAPCLNIECKKEYDEITLTVTDNGARRISMIREPDTRKKDQPQGHESFGMQLISIQVQQLYGSFQVRFDEGTVFSMKFDLS
jgi:two-component sensor histidine kinase